VTDYDAVERFIQRGGFDADAELRAEVERLTSERDEARAELEQWHHAMRNAIQIPNTVAAIDALPKDTTGGEVDHE
jgi:hypothetical protein